MTAPHVIVIFVGEECAADPGEAILDLVQDAWHVHRVTALLVDADPAGRLTRAARRPERGFYPSHGPVSSLDAHLDAAAELGAPLVVSPWRLSKRARSLIPFGGDPVGAHVRALAAVLTTGGALDLRARVRDVLCPAGLDVQWTLVLAPPSSSGLGSLLASVADVVVAVGDNWKALGRMVNAVETARKAADPFGPEVVVPALHPPVAPLRGRGFHMLELLELMEVQPLVVLSDPKESDAWSALLPRLVTALNSRAI